jgi:hypothetical protein
MTESSPALQNPAVAHCCDAWEQAYQTSVEEDERESDFYARSVAGEAYRNALPALSGFQNISDFIACAAHGMLIGAIAEKSVTRLMYAAQVAIGTARQAKAQLPVV